MKTTILKFAMLSLIVLGSFSSCEEKDSAKECECSGEGRIGITNQHGTIGFNEELQKWGISVHEEETYDEVQLYFPCELKEPYRFSNTEVIFSGVATTLPVDIAAPAGVSYHCIELSFIAITN